MELSFVFEKTKIPVCWCILSYVPVICIDNCVVNVNCKIEMILKILQHTQVKLYLWDGSICVKSSNYLNSNLCLLEISI
jgi:hypothetical protein